jgi:hypothetical protein
MHAMAVSSAANRMSAWLPPIASRLRFASQLWSVLMTAAVAHLWIKVAAGRDALCAARASIAAKDRDAEDAAAEMQRLRTGMKKSAALLAVKAAAASERAAVPRASALQPTLGWTRCTEAMAAMERGYRAGSTRAAKQRSRTDEPKQVLFSSYDLERAGGGEKQRVDRLLSEHAKKHLPNLAQSMRDDPRLLILLLDAPACGTTNALVAGSPGLRELGSRICIPQADPAHYSLMVGVPAAGSAAAVSDAMMLNVRCQRLDEWLACNASKGVRVALFFADYETSIYGRQNVAFSPIDDLQRFFRNGFAHSRCLLGVTLSYRTTSHWRYSADAPRLTPEDLAGFVSAEAGAQGLDCELLEVVPYGMTFSLFLLSRRAQA